MASIPCAAYQASHIHGNIRKQTQCRSRNASGESNRSNSPPSSPPFHRKRGSPDAMVIRISSLWQRNDLDNWQPGLYSPDSTKSMTETFVNNVIAPFRKTSWSWSNQYGPSQPSDHKINEDRINKRPSSD